MCLWDTIEAVLNLAMYNSCCMSQKETFKRLNADKKKKSDYCHQKIQNPIYLYKSSNFT